MALIIYCYKTYYYALRILFWIELVDIGSVVYKIILKKTYTKIKRYFVNILLVTTWQVRDELPHYILAVQYARI